MRIHVYAACYNEEILLPYFLRHYLAFAEKVVIFDDQSTDRSREIMANHPRVECIVGSPVYSDASRKVSETLLLKMKNEAYKSSRASADWVVVVDIDEFIVHPDLVGLLGRYKASGITLPSVEGFDMVSGSIPSTGGQIYDEIPRGFRNVGYSKSAVFDPALEIGYHPGAHTCNPRGRVSKSEYADLKLLHYRFLGPDHFVKRYLARKNSLSEENLNNGWGTLVTVPGIAGTRSISTLNEEQLRKLYHEILNEQKIEDVLQSPVSRSPLT